MIVDVERSNAVQSVSGLVVRPRPAALARRLAAEAIGTFWLVLGGCGAAVLAAGAHVPGSIGLVGVALAFGLSVFTMAFAVGFISGGHFNPAVTVGLVAAGRFRAAELPPYVAAQLIGGALASGALAILASGTPGFDLVASGFAANGYGAHSPGAIAWLQLCCRRPSSPADSCS